MASILNTLRTWRCARMETRLVDLAAGTLAAGERPSVDAHLRGCARCREAVEDLRTVPQTFSAVESDDPGPQYWLQQRHAIMQTIREIESAPVDEPEVVAVGWDWRFAMVPVTALLVAGLGWIALQRQMTAISEQVLIPVPAKQVELALLDVAPMFGVDLVEIAPLELVLDASVDDVDSPLGIDASVVELDVKFEDLDESDQNLVLEWFGDVG